MDGYKFVLTVKIDLLFSVGAVKILYLTHFKETKILQCVEAYSNLNTDVWYYFFIAKIFWEKFAI